MVQRRCRLEKSGNGKNACSPRFTEREIVFLETCSRAYGDVMHEYGHALCDTIYGDNYLDHVPERLNEGMADAVAKP